MEMTTEERMYIIPELCEAINKLPEAEQTKLSWIAQGILIASQAKQNG